MLIDQETGEITFPVIQAMRHQIKGEIIELRITTYHGAKGIISTKVSRVVVRRVPPFKASGAAQSRG